MEQFKVGGHRPDPQNIEYKQFDNSIFSNYLPSYSGDADLREFSSPRHNQRRTSTCAAQSTIKALEIKRIQKYGKDAHVALSVMDLYFGARDEMIPKETHIDNGTHIYLVCNVLKTFGVCREELNPFDEANLFKPTPVLATRESYMNKIHDAFKIQEVGNERVEAVIKHLRMGNPVVFGTAIDNHWFLYNSNSEPLGVTKREESKGNHATCIVGWVDGCFVIENSWGNAWGQDGFVFLRPEVIASDISSDFWVIAEGSEVWVSL